MNMVMKSVFNLLNILTQSHSHTLAGFHYPQKTQRIHKSRQQPSVWHTQSQVCLPADLGLPAGDARALGSQEGWGRSINAVFLKSIEGSILTLIGVGAGQSVFDCYEKTQ